MSKISTTRKAISNGFDCISIGYCNAQNLLYFHNPRFYTHGVHGWNFDAYVVNYGNREICITTGYRGMVDNVPNNNSYALVREYDDKAEKIRFSSLSWEEQKTAVESLLQEYLGKVFEA